MISQRIHKTVLILGTVFFLTGLYAKDKHQPDTPPQDEIQVVAHIPVSGDQIIRFFTTQHYQSKYLYAEHESGKTVTLIDVTNISRPSVLAEMSYPTGGLDRLAAVTGNAALVSSKNSATEAQPSPRIFRILSFADPRHPTVQQEFDNVTATTRDDRRGLIFLANAEGLWVLQQKFAMDPEAVKEWEHMMLDAR